MSRFLLPVLFVAQAVLAPFTGFSIGPRALAMIASMGSSPKQLWDTGVSMVRFVFSDPNI